MIPGSKVLWNSNSTVTLVWGLDKWENHQSSQQSMSFTKNKMFIFGAREVIFCTETSMIQCSL